MKTLEDMKTNGLLATEINKLESRLWSQVKRDRLQTVMITSAVRGEGKSMTAAYLATALGMYPGRRILAMDFDFRIPTMARQFGLPVPVGIDRVLEGEAELSTALIKTELPGLHFAAPTPGGADPGLLLRTHLLRDMFTALRESFDLILVDTPAIIPVSDPTMILPFADGVMLAAMAGKTTAPQLRRAREICEGMDANIIGLVVGNVEEAAPDYIADSYNYGYETPAVPASAQPGGRRGSRSTVPNGPRRKKPAGRH